MTQFSAHTLKLKAMTIFQRLGFHNYHLICK